MILFEANFLQPLKHEYLNRLGESYGFKVWETYCNDQFSVGTLKFDTFLDTYTFFRENIQCSYLEFNNPYYENHSGKIATELLKAIGSGLNEDCIYEIAKRLDLIGLADLYSLCKIDRLKSFICYKYSILIIDRNTVGRVFGLMNLCYVLHQMGDIVENISVSLLSFRGGSQYKGSQKLVYGILYSVCYLTGANLKSITLRDCEICEKNVYFQSLINTLQQKNVTLNYIAKKSL